jgi:hypothetical protein
LSLRLEDGGIVADGEAIVRARIVAAALIPHGADVGLPMIRLRLKDPDETRRFVVATVAEGRGVLAHLGFDLAHGPVRFTVASPVLRYRVFGIVGTAVMTALAIFFGFLFHLSFNMVVIPLLSILGLFVALGSIQETVRIGLDGIGTEWLGRRRFVPISAVREVRSGVAPPKATEAELAEQLGTRFGVTIQVHAADDLEIEVADAEQAEVIAERVQEAMDGAKAAEHPIFPALLRPPGASATEWIQRLRAAGTGANVTLRVAPVDEAELWTVLDNPAARPEDRAAAAVALTIHGDEAKRRVRVAAESVVEDSLRAALEAAAGEDEQALEAALSRVDRDP